MKVHRDQCAALADKVETPVSLHRPDSCPGCKEETDMGGDISSPDSPAWGCLLSGKEYREELYGFPSAAESGEVTRRAHRVRDGADRAETE